MNNVSFLLQGIENSYNCDCFVKWSINGNRNPQAPMLFGLSRFWEEEHFANRDVGKIFVTVPKPILERFVFRIIGILLERMSKHVRKKLWN